MASLQYVPTGLLNTDYLILKQLYHYGPCFTGVKQKKHREVK